MPPLRPAQATKVAGTLLAKTRQPLELELFKPSTDSASLLVDIEKKSFSFSVGGSLGGPPQVGVFWKIWPALGPNPLTHSFDSKFC